jgi:DNA-binding response OmpR family regulator
MGVDEAEGHRMPDTPAGRTILIVDDEVLIRRVVEDFLTTHGFTCRTARNGAEALQACEASPPNLILLDIMMPEMDGIETCRRLKATPAWAAIPVIALTALDDPATVLRMQEAGSLMYLIKPIAADRLLAAVQLALEARSP